MVQWIKKLINHLTLGQKFFISSLIFGLAILVAISWMISLQNKAIRSATLEILGNNYERLVSAVYADIALHHLLMQYYANDGKKNRTALNELESKIADEFKNLVNFDEEVEKDIKATSESFEKNKSRNLKPLEIFRRWNQMLQDMNNAPLEEINTMHSSVLKDLQALLLYISTNSDLLQDPHIGDYYLINTLYWLLAENLRLISSINFEYESLLTAVKKNPKEVQEIIDKLREYNTIFNLYLTESKREYKCSYRLRKKI